MSILGNMILGLIETFFGLAILYLLVYFCFTSNFNFWKNRNVKGPLPLPIFGNFKEIMFNTVSIGDMFTRFYNQFPAEPFVGVYSRRTPVLIIRDAEQIKNVLIKDFSSFASRGVQIYEKIEPLSCHLFALEPEKWRPLRTNLSPVFTSGKLKEMFYLLRECADHFGKFLDSYVASHPSEIECRELTAKFATDVIGVCAFGLKMNALDDENSEFRKYGREIVSINWRKVVKNFLRQATPWLFQLLGPIMSDKKTNEFFVKCIQETMEYRRQNHVKRNDFVDLLIEMKENPGILENVDITDELLTAQAFVFFVAGFETSSTTISNALYELALNPLIQDRLRKEIIEIVGDEKMKYDDIKNMKYLNQVFCETLRKYPPATNLMRQACKDYTFPGTTVSIPKGMRIFIPVYAIQRDPKIYSKPDEFNPERFEEENVKVRHPSHYLPFGDGPRNCIGARFANYQTKVGLMTIIKNFKVHVSANTCIPYVNLAKGNNLLAPKGGIHLRFEKLRQTNKQLPVEY